MLRSRFRYDYEQGMLEERMTRSPQSSLYRRPR